MGKQDHSASNLPEIISSDDSADLAAQDSIMALTGIRTTDTYIGMCHTCTNTHRYMAEWLYVSGQKKPIQIAKLIGVSLDSVLNHLAHTGLKNWRVTKQGLLSTMREVIESGIINKKKTRVADAVAAAKLAAQLQGHLVDQESTTQAVLDALRGAGKEHSQVILDDISAGAEEAELIPDDYVETYVVDDKGDTHHPSNNSPPITTTQETKSSATASQQPANSPPATDRADDFPEIW